jgi:NDP-sugar pyrophosphorylase family protein
VAYVNRGYWIDIGTPDKYMQVHHDIMDGRFRAAPFAAASSNAWISPQARLEEGVTIEGPCFVDEGTVVKAGAHIGAYTVIGRQCHIEEHAIIERSILWANSRVCQEAIVRRSILGRQCHIGRSAIVEDGVVLGDKSVVTDFSRL